MKFTILGSRGFIGRHLTDYLHRQGAEVETVPRDASGLRGGNLGHVIYAIGLTGNWRQQPGAAVEAHVNVLQRMIEGADFESWLYLSSTRVYGILPAGEIATKDANVPVRLSGDSIFDLSKLLGEAICLGKNDPTVRVARLSNVYGADQSVHTFLGSIMTDIAATGKVVFGEASLSSKDYVSIDDAVSMLHKIALQGKQRLYNVARGKPITHHEVAECLRRCGYSAGFAKNGQTRAFPTIDTRRIVGEFGDVSGSLLEDLPSLIRKRMLLAAA